MLTRLVFLLGVILLIIGVLKFVGLIAIASAGAVTLIVVGIIVILVAQYVLGGWYSGRGSGPVV